MANNFSSDPSCKALWRFENGALTADSKGTNTLTAGGTPTADTGDFEEGAAAVAYGGAAYHYRTDAGLDAGFPFKNGDTTKLATICCWVKVTSGETIWSKFNTGSGRTLALRTGGGNVSLMYGTSSGGSSEYTLGTLPTGVWHHVSVVIDGVNGRIWAVIYNATTGATQFFNMVGLAAIYVGTAQWSIGERGNNEGYKLTGKIDEVVVFNALKSYPALLAIRQQTYSGTGPTLLVNNFTGDDRFKAWWKFDTTAGILNDAIGGNTLSTYLATPYSDPVMFMLGAGSGVFNRSSSGAYLKVDDASLSAGFPLKNGDTVKQITVCCWVPPTFAPGNGNYNNLLWQKNNLSLWYSQYNSGSPPSQLFVKWGAETFNLGIGLTHDRFWHVTVVADGVNKTLKVRVYNTATGTATNYTFTPAATLTVTNGSWYVFGNGGAYDEGNNADELIVAAGLLSDAEIDKIWAGTYVFVHTYDLTTTVAAASAVSAPIAAITRPLASSPAAVSAVAAPILAVTRALQAAVAAGSATSTPSLLILRALISAISGVSGVGTMNLAVERPLSSSLGAISAVSTPNLAVQRALASLAAVMSATPNISLFLNAILDLTTAAAIQSQGSTPALKVVRPLGSAIAGQTQGSNVILALLRSLAVTVVSESQVSDITLKVWRDLATTISGQSAVSTPAFNLSRLLTTTISGATATPTVLLAMLWDLVTSIAAQTDASGVDMRVAGPLHLITTILAQTVTSDVLLAMGIPRDLATALMAITQTSDIDLIMAFHESLLAKAKRYYGPSSAVDLKAAALQWVETEEDKEANLPGDQYNDHEF